MRTCSRSNGQDRRAPARPSSSASSNRLHVGEAGSAVAAWPTLRAAAPVEETREPRDRDPQGGGEARNLCRPTLKEPVPRDLRANSTDAL